MSLLAMDASAYLHPDSLNLLISKLLRKNRCFGGAAVRVTVYRNPSEWDVPERNDVSFVIDSRGLDHDFYTLNSDGFTIDVFQELKKFVHPLSSIRNADPFLFLKAAQFCHQHKLDDCVFLNDHNRIVETLHANIFLVKDQSVYTPSLTEGCIPGVLRGVMVELCSKSGYRVNDQCRLSHEALADADEILLTDAVNGLRWVGAFRQKRYYKRDIRQMLSSLNRLAFGK
jgi:branched-chain amino acid aminotransferase